MDYQGYCAKNNNICKMVNVVHKNTSESFFPAMMYYNKELSMTPVETTVGYNG